MIPILYPRIQSIEALIGRRDINSPSDLGLFVTNGIGALSDCINCKVTEERNGQFELVFDYPEIGIHYSDIVLDSVIVVPVAPTSTSSRKKQAFLIYSKSEPINGTVTFNAHHISYILSYIPVKPLIAYNLWDALADIRDRCIVPNPFSLKIDPSKLTNENKFFIIESPRSVRECIGGSDDSILAVFSEKEIEWDNFDIKFSDHRGLVNPRAVLEYGKNITEYNHETSTEEIVDGIYPYWLSSDGNEYVTCGEVYAVKDLEFRKLLEKPDDWDSDPFPENKYYQLKAKNKYYIVDSDLPPEWKSDSKYYLRLDVGYHRLGDLVLEGDDLPESFVPDFKPNLYYNKSGGENILINTWINGDASRTKDLSFFALTSAVKFVANIYFSRNNDDTYTLLDTQPADWPNKDNLMDPDNPDWYKKYYTLEFETNKYSQLLDPVYYLPYDGTEELTPIFESDVFYETYTDQESGDEKYRVLVNQPDDWNTRNEFTDLGNWRNYYQKEPNEWVLLSEQPQGWNSTIEDPDEVSFLSKFYYFNDENYSVISDKPSGWDDGDWKNYYYYVSSYERQYLNLTQESQEASYFFYYKEIIEKPKNWDYIFDGYYTRQEENIPEVEDIIRYSDSVSILKSNKTYKKIDIRLDNDPTFNWDHIEASKTYITLDTPIHPGEILKMYVNSDLFKIRDDFILLCYDDSGDYYFGIDNVKWGEEIEVENTDQSHDITHLIVAFNNEDPVTGSIEYQIETDIFDFANVKCYKKNETLYKDERSYPHMITFDCSSYFEEKPLSKFLKGLATEILNQSDFDPKENITVSFASLLNSSEYITFKDLETVDLCDNVLVRYKNNRTFTMKVVKTEYDVLLDRYSSIELGKTFDGSFSTTIGSLEQRVEQKIEKTKFNLQSRIDDQINLMNGGLGGNVYINKNAAGKPCEILIGDTDNVNTMKNILRINQNGIAFSQSGYNGLYTTAWSIDSKFNASNIGFGLLEGSLIKTGSITADQIDSGVFSDIVDSITNLSNDVYMYDASGNKIPIKSWFRVKDGRLFIGAENSSIYMVQGASSTDGSVRIEFRDFNNRSSESDTEGKLLAYISGDRFFTIDLKLGTENNNIDFVYDEQAGLYLLPGGGE